MLNWNIIPMTYNDSFTYMEWLGKLNYVAELHEQRLDQQEKEIVDLWTKVNDHEDRIGTLETWRVDEVDPFIEATTQWMGEIDTWKEGIDGDISDIKGDILDMQGTIADNYDDLNGKINAERAARETSAGAINEKLDQVKETADGALQGVISINQRLDEVGGIRYFMVDLVNEATITTSGSDKVITFPLPDDKFSIIDVRGHYSTTEFRVTTNILGTIVTSGDYIVQVKAPVGDGPYTVELTITGGAAETIDRLDYILYTAALKPGEQSQADIDFFNKMDANGDGIVDAVDASRVLNYYAWVSTLHPGDPGYGLSGQELWTFYANKINTERGQNVVVTTAYPDFTGDGIIDAVDASKLLAYYAWVSTRSDNSMTGPELMRAFRDGRR